jgi:acyl-CoA:acyl-CoA alkyltransferase
MYSGKGTGILFPANSLSRWWASRHLRKLTFHHFVPFHKKLTENNMEYSKVYIDSFGYELAPHVVASEDLEDRLESLYETLHFKKGQLEALTGVRERRYWYPGYKISEGAIKAGQKALNASNVGVGDIGMLVYCGVCRDNLEPATACVAAHGLNLGVNAHIYDVSNACLGMLNGMVNVANAIELGQIKAGMVVSCESAREIVDLSIDRLLASNDMETYKKCVATLTGGAGAAAIILTADSVSDSGHRIAGGIIKNAAEHHELCRWGPDTGMPASGLHTMETDSVGVLKNGVELGIKTFNAFKEELRWPEDKPDKIICHQVGSSHQKTILNSINIPKEKDFTTFEYLGNIGTVSLPVTAAIAHERDFLLPGEKVGFFGIGSGLNCLMIGVEW